MSYDEIPYDVLEAALNPSLNAFLRYVESCLGDGLSVWDCSVLLAGLDAAGRTTAEELEGLNGEVPVDRQRDLACCDGLADRLRAKRRRLVEREVQLFLQGLRSLDDFLSSVVLPMLSRRWLPAAWYEPARGDHAADIRTWQGQHINFYEQLKDFHFRHELRAALVRAGTHGSNNDKLWSIISALRQHEFVDAPSRETASYLAAALRSSNMQSRFPLETPIILKRHNQPDRRPGNVLSALLVPFNVRCTGRLARESLLPAIQAVRSYFSDRYDPQALLRGLVIGDYPGGVHCPGNAVCVPLEDASRTDCDSSLSWFRGPSASPAFGALLAAHALGLKIRSHSYATAKLVNSGRIEALSAKKAANGDPYLQAKGRTMALLAHASGSTDITVVVSERNLDDLRTGAERYREEADPGSAGNRTPAKPAWAVSWQAVSSLRDTLDYFLSTEIEGCIWPGIYQDLIANLAPDEDGGSAFAAAAARRILTDVDIDRWIVSLPAQTHGVEGTGGFEMDLAREIYRLSTSLGMVRVPVRVSITRFFLEYAGRHHISIYRPEGSLGATVAHLGCINLARARTEQHQVWAYQVERDLHEGRLILMLGGLPCDDPHGSIYDIISTLIESLRSQRDSESQWDVRKIVAVTHARVRDSHHTARQVFEDYGFREIKLEDEALPGQVLD